MGAYEKVVQGAAEKLLEDERLRANLDDEEANLLVNWAIEWLEGSVTKARDEATARQIAQKEATRLRPAMQKINDTLSESKTSSPSAGAVSFGLSAPGAAPRDRKALIRKMTTELAEAWRKQ
jgi:hypothetical protein